MKASVEHDHAGNLVKNVKWIEFAGCNVWFHDFCLDNKDQNLNLTFCCSNCNF